MIDRAKILDKYMKWVNEVSDLYPEKAGFYPAEIVNAVCDIVDQELKSDLLHNVMCCSVKDIDKFYNETGYSDNTNDWGIRKAKRNEWDWKNPSQMIKDWMKWKRNNA